MNGVTKPTTVSPVQLKPVAVVVTSTVEKGQKTGNELPAPIEAAKNHSVSVKDLQAVQEKVQAAVAQMNEFIQSTQRDLHFSYDAESGNTIVKVIDRNTQEVIRQIPDQIFLKIAEALDSQAPLSLFNASV
ncbi:MAG: flagellar protein FlaG [Cellvibrio sp.]|nr:flagellar protein FlaG [Cellvibrio sp.]